MSLKRRWRIDPDNVELRREFAYLQLQMDHRNEAETQFAAIVDRTSGDLSSLAQLGLLKMSQGDTASAMGLLNPVLSGNDEELAGRVRTALRLPETLRARAAVEPHPATQSGQGASFQESRKRLFAGRAALPGHRP